MTVYTLPLRAFTHCCFLYRLVDNVCVCCCRINACGHRRGANRRIPRSPTQIRWVPKDFKEPTSNIIKMRWCLTSITSGKTIGTYFNFTAYLTVSLGPNHCKSRDISCLFKLYDDPYHLSLIWTMKLHEDITMFVCEQLYYIMLIR